MPVEMRVSREFFDGDGCSWKVKAKDIVVHDDETFVRLRCGDGSFARFIAQGTASVPERKFSWANKTAWSHILAARNHAHLAKFAEAAQVASAGALAKVFGGGSSRAPPPKRARKTWACAAKQRCNAHTVEVTLNDKTLVCMRPLSPTDALVIPCKPEAIETVKEYVALCGGVDEFSSEPHTETGYYAPGGQWYAAKQRRAVNADEFLSALRREVDGGSSDDNTDGDGSDDDAAGCDQASYADVEGGTVD